MPTGPPRVAHDCFIGRACGQEVTVGDAPALSLPDLHVQIRRRIKGRAELLPDACAVIVDTVCFYWPQKYMASVARRSAEETPELLDALDVVSAKAREDLEARYGMATNTIEVLDNLVRPVVNEIANVWFDSIEARVDLRLCMWQIRRRQR
ncbi:MAG: hypothetical protein HQ464_02555 [Planctomycetes bacterium]|nr:hypothetical protein [Planctomycetota bacterium]